MIKKLEKLEIIEVEQEDIGRMNFRFPPAPHSGKISLSLKNISKNYDKLTVLEKVNLDSKKHNRPGELSGGERQRVAIARSLSNSPSCLLMDEPTGNLDKNNAQIITNLVLELVKEEGATLIIATHDMALAERLDARLNLELR